jgi:predicted glycogen debranching enzyme
MLTLEKPNEKTGICVETAGVPVERLLEKEWLLTNLRGGYASSTVIGCNTRRYHGLLIGSLDPPVNRVLAFSSCLETVTIGPARFELATCEFPDKILPDGFQHLRQFYRVDSGVHFHYQLGDLGLKKSVYLLHEQDTAAIVYEFSGVSQPVDFALRPFAAMRDFHSLQKSESKLECTSVSEGQLIRNSSQDCGCLLLDCPGASFEKDEQWWFNFTYRCDRERGQDFMEDLFSPGVFKCRIESPKMVVVWADLSKEYKPGRFVPPDIEYAVGRLSRHHQAIAAEAKDDKLLGTLFAAADQFIARRKTRDIDTTTILAGYPWFADWGRDAFISLPGLLLAANRFEEAKAVLACFAQAASQGMIPNRFDDYTNTAHFNSIDSSLWFINAAFAYLEASGDRWIFDGLFLPKIVSIIDSYRKGTRFDIHADNDGLITGGDFNTQLTWMDAKCGGIAFTPRHGKAVEINALWFNALMLLNKFYDSDNQQHNDLKLEIDKVGQSFCRLFWNESWGWLNDCVLPDDTADATLRPNQIFAVSLPFSPLSSAQQKAVVNIVEQKLLTPFGLRTLSPDDRRYHGKYSGHQGYRDRAYHQGTVWPWLMGPFVEAYLKVNDYDLKSKKSAARFIEPLLTHLTSDGCIGQLCEIFDGDPPHRPKGCFAQAWSIAGLIRAYLLTKD